MANHKVIPTPKICPACGTEFLTGGRGRPRLSTVYCTQRCAVMTRNTKLPEIRTLASHEAAYVAGLFDGEGSIIEYRRNEVYTTKPTLRVQVSNTYLPVLTYIRKITETGSIIEQTRREANPKHSDCYFWQCYAENAVKFLQMIHPWPIIKKDRAEEAIIHQRPNLDLDDVIFEITLSKEISLQR